LSSVPIWVISSYEWLRNVKPRARKNRESAVSPAYAASNCPLHCGQMP
jgi:hypothetical protein